MYEIAIAIAQYICIYVLSHIELRYAALFWFHVKVHE